MKNSEQIAFRKTGDSGSLTFNELDKGRYNIVVVFPAQKGKLAHGRKKMNLNLKVTPMPLFGFHIILMVGY